LNGFDVSTFSSGPALLADSHLDQFCCLILDVHMPTMSGIELLELLRRRAISIPVIMMSGRSDPALMERACTCGAVTFMQKPVLEQALVSNIQNALTSGVKCHT
jgi:FixJ family two-component response regulator